MILYDSSIAVASSLTSFAKQCSVALCQNKNHMFLSHWSSRLVPTSRHHTTSPADAVMRPCHFMKSCEAAPHAVMRDGTSHCPVMRAHQLTLSYHAPLPAQVVLSCALASSSCLIMRPCQLKLSYHAPLPAPAVRSCDLAPSCSHPRRHLTPSRHATLPPHAVIRGGTSRRPVMRPCHLMQSSEVAPHTVLSCDLAS
jgi:hypothetical protein